jgi:hypothetical protein
MSIKEETINQISKTSIKSGVLDRTIPSIVADSADTSNVGAKKDTPAFLPTGRTTDKIFQLPDGTRTAANTISKLPWNIRQPAKDIHIVPSIPKNSLLSIPQIVDAGIHHSI